MLQKEPLPLYIVKSLASVAAGIGLVVIVMNGIALASGDSTLHPMYVILTFIAPLLLVKVLTDLLISSCMRMFKISFLLSFSIIVLIIASVTGVAVLYSMRYLMDNFLVPALVFGVIAKIIDHYVLKNSELPSFNNMNLPKITHPNRKWKEIILWWEIRRVPYNVIMGVVGVMSFLVSSYLTISPIYILIGLSLNVFYTFGWIVELALQGESNNIKMSYPKNAFICILGLSAIVIFGLPLIN